MQRDALGDPDADRGDLAFRAAGRRRAARRRCGPSTRLAVDAELGADLDQHALHPADVGDHVDRVGQPQDRVADELARAVPGDLAAAVDVDDRGAVDRALPRLGALAGGVDRRVLEQQDGVRCAPATTSAWSSRWRAQACSYGTSPARITCTRSTVAVR